MLSVVILDFDGVVVESNEVKRKAFEEVFFRFPEHADAMMDFHHKNVSLGRLAKFDHLLGLMGRPGDAVLKEEIAEEFSRKVLHGMMDVPLVKGAETFLRRVTARLPVYLASVTPEDELFRVLDERGLEHWFSDVYGCPPWTKPKAIRDVLDREGVPAEEVLLVGDSAGDQHAAAAEGVRFLGRDSGLGFDTPIPLIFDDMVEVTRYLEELIP